VSAIAKTGHPDVRKLQKPAQVVPERAFVLIITHAGLDISLGHLKILYNCEPGLIIGDKLTQFVDRS